MMDLATQLFGLGCLLGGIGLGYRLATRPYRGQLAPAQKGIILLVLLTLMGGFVGAFAWWIDLPSGFAWDLPPLASRMLAAAGWAFALACLLALRNPTRRHLRLITLMLTIYLLPLAVAIVIVHLDRFDPNAPITYAFFIIVGIMVSAALWFLLRPVGVAAQAHTPGTPPSLIQSWLQTVALLTGLWGSALFITAAGPSALIWVWPQDLLASRLIAVMLLTIAGAALYSVRYAYLARTTLWMIALYGIGVGAAGLWNLTAGKPVPVLYVALFGLFALVSALLGASQAKPT
jgi:hypothetical protein